MTRPCDDVVVFRMFRVAYVLVAGCRVGFDPVPVPAPEPMRHELCADRTAVISDGLNADDSVGAQLLNVLVTACGGSETRTISQDAPGVLDPSGRLLLGPDELAIVPGGNGPQRALEQLHKADTPVTWTDPPNVTFTERASNRLLVAGTASQTHDYALLMIVLEPISGTRVLSASGMTSAGTRAAGYWFETMIAPDLDAFHDWVLVEWTNADATPGPSAGDVYEIRE